MTTNRQDLREEILSIVHLCGCQSYDIGWTEALSNKEEDRDMIKVEELEAMAADELVTLFKSKDRLRTGRAGEKVASNFRPSFQTLRHSIGHTKVKGEVKE